MERNVHFATSGLKDIVIHLAWAQLEIFADDVEKIQIMAAGDETSVSDLRIGVKDNSLLVEQSQYGLSLNITESKWMQVCVRVPQSWEHQIHANTIGGLLSARGLRGQKIVLDTINGDIRAVRLNSPEVRFKTISGDVRAENLQSKDVSVRSVSGDVVLDDIATEALKCTSVSGEQIYNLSSSFRRVDVNAVSGDVIITSPLHAVYVAMRSVSGRVRTEGVTRLQEEGEPTIQVTGISANVKLIAVPSPQ